MHTFSAQVIYFVDLTSKFNHWQIRHQICIQTSLRSENGELTSFPHFHRNWKIQWVFLWILSLKSFRKCLIWCGIYIKLILRNKYVLKFWEVNATGSCWKNIESAFVLPCAICCFNFNWFRVNWACSQWSVTIPFAKQWANGYHSIGFRLLHNWISSSALFQ